MRDYPRALVLSFEILPVPEVIDHLSREARRASRDIRDEGINRTPEIAAACAREDVQAYFDCLVKMAGQIVTPEQLKPPFKPSERFKFAHPIPETKLFLCLTEKQSQHVEERITCVDIYCHGPNLGSAGGPTLLSLGSVGQIRYQGLLL